VRKAVALDIARRRAAGKDQAGDAIAQQIGRGDRDGAAERPTVEHHARGAAAFDDRGHVACNRADRHIAEVAVGAAAAAVIDDDRAMALGKQRLDRRGPIIARHAPTVDQHNGEARRAVMLVIDATAVIGVEIGHENSYSGADKVTPGSGLK